MPSYVGPIHSGNDGFSISCCDVTMFSWFVLYTSTASPTSTAILVHFLRKIPLNLKLMAGSLKGYNQILWKVIECYKTCLDCVISTIISCYLHLISLITICLPWLTRRNSSLIEWWPISTCWYGCHRGCTVFSDIKNQINSLRPSDAYMRW